MSAWQNDMKVDLEKLIFKNSQKKIFLKDQHELTFLINIKTL